MPTPRQLYDEACARLQTIRTRPAGFYWPATDGKLAIVQPVEDAQAELIDLCGWRPEQPDLWWLRTGMGLALGERALLYAYYGGPPARLISTPERWQYVAAHVPQAVCIVNRSRERAALAGIPLEGRADGT